MEPINEENDEVKRETNSDAFPVNENENDIKVVDALEFIQKSQDRDSRSSENENDNTADDRSDVPSFANNGRHYIPSDSDEESKKLY